MHHDATFLIAVFYSIVGELGIVIEHLTFAHTPIVKGESLIAAFYAGKEIKDGKVKDYHSGVVLFKHSSDGVCFLQKIPIHCSRDLTDTPILKGVITMDGEWLLIDLGSVNKGKPMVIGYYNPMAFVAPMGHPWQIAIPRQHPYNLSPFGGIARLDTAGRLVHIS